MSKALSQIKSSGRQYIEELIQFPSQIGLSECVKTGPSDIVGFARRPGRIGYTRFVAQRIPEPCSTLAVVLRKEDHGDRYLVMTAYPGFLGVEPWDQKANDATRAFWAKHALVLEGEQAICFQCDEGDGTCVMYDVVLCQECIRSFKLRYPRLLMPLRAQKYLAGWGKIYYPCMLAE